MKKYLICVIAVLLAFAMSISVFAADFTNSSSALTLTANEVNRGDTFSVTVALTNAETIRMATAVLTYDTTVFEFVGGQTLVKGTSIAQVDLHDENPFGTFFISNGAVVSGDIFRFDLKVKENAPYGNYEIGNATSIGVNTGQEITATGTTVCVACLNHTFDQQVSTDTYKVSAATCTAGAVYCYSCACGAKGTETYEEGPREPHNFDQQVATDAYLATSANCQSPATYYYSCVCGLKETYTFQSGGLGAHSFGEWMDVEEDNHERECSIPGCTATETEAHRFGDWENVDKVYKKKTCVGCGAERMDYIDYTVTFRYGNGDVISQTTYHYGQTVTIPDAPAPSYLVGEYEFDGWDVEVSTTCTGDAVYVAQYLRLNPIGDLDSNKEVNCDDAICLLLHISMPDMFPLETSVEADFSGDGCVDQTDVVYLLLHITLPDRFPLQLGKQ